MKRRNFLQMLGIGGIAAVVPAPLFGAVNQPTTLWTPGQKSNLAGGHIVLVRPKGGVSTFGKRIPLGQGPAGSYKLMVKSPWPIVTGNVYHERLMMNDAASKELRVQDNPAWPGISVGGQRRGVEVLLSEGADSHLAFYKASMQMRNNIKQSSVEMLAKVPQWERQGAQIVTVVDNPIFMGALPAKHWEGYVADADGFTVEADYSQYVVNGDVDPNGWEVYSEVGEFPIEVPSKIDMDLLLVLDAKVFNGDLKLPKGANRIIV